jgi:hypothetical protein
MLSFIIVFSKDWLKTVGVSYNFYQEECSICRVFNEIRGRSVHAKYTVWTLVSKSACQATNLCAISYPLIIIIPQPFHCQITSILGQINYSYECREKYVHIYGPK